MPSIAIAAIWAGVVVYLLVRVERGYRDWLKLQDPPHAKQLSAIEKRLDDLQNQVSRLSIEKDFS